MNVITVTGNIVSKNGITLFLGDGTSMVLGQNEFRTREIVAVVMKGLIEDGTATVDLDQFSLGALLKELHNTSVPVDQNGALTIKSRDGKKIKTEAVIQLVEQAVKKDGKGLKAFLAEMKKIKRGHTVEELLKFIEDGKMMIADDGSILCYKILKVISGKWYDPHSGKVQQQVGSLVYMPESKVSDDRRQACAVGLHVCSAHYISGFWGDDRVLTLVKVKPSDVIAVPFRETTKMRACAYQIIAQIPSNLSDEIRRRVDPMSVPELAAIYNKAMIGDHPGIKERVAVSGYGSTVIEKIASKVARVLATPEKLAKKSHSKKGMSVKEAREQITEIKKNNGKAAPTPSNDRSESDVRFAEAFKKAKQTLKTKAGKAAFSLRAFCKTHGISRTRLTLRLKEAGLIN